MTRFLQGVAGMAAAFAAGCATAAEPDNPAASDVGAVLKEFADDYAKDPMLIDATFGVQLGDRWWTIAAKKGEDGAPSKVDFREGKPDKPTWYYTVADRKYIDQIYSGEMNAGTIMVKEWSTDIVPIDTETMEGFTPDSEYPGGNFYEEVIRVTFHFWYRGFPEIVKYGLEHTRMSHGADMTIFYYQPGLRSGYFNIKKGQHVNADPKYKGVPFPKILVFTGGKGKASIRGTVVDVQAGESLFVPPNSVDQFWTDEEAPLEGVLIMFGEGA